MNRIDFLTAALIAIVATSISAQDAPKPPQKRVIAKPGERAMMLFGGTLDGWKPVGDASKNHWRAGVAKVSKDDPTMLEVEEGKQDLINDVHHHGEGVDIATTATFGDCRLNLDVLVPKGSNSGIYLMGEYEVQVFDSYGREKMEMSDMGAIYGAAPPKVNASKPPGEWQHYAIEFRAPRFDEKGEKVENARFIRVELNGKVIHEDVEMKGPTPGGLTGKESAQGPLMLQGNHGPVAFRNLIVAQK